MTAPRHHVPGMRARRERVLYLVPSPATPGLSTSERLALTLRRDATVSGRCACGAVRPRIRVHRGEVMHFVMEHEADCPAADGPHLEALVRRLGQQLEHEAIIVEVELAA
jgi:hypothetical protein